jgi:hypothetical protein
MAVRHVRFAALLLPVLLSLSCGGGDDGGSSTTTPMSPTPTTPPPSGVATISGNWNGTSDFQQNGIRRVSNTTATITQNDRAVEGTVIFTSPGWEGWRANLTGTLAGTSPDTQFVGTVTVQSPSSTGTGICLGNVSMAGRSVSSGMRWEAPVLTMTSDVPSQPASACRGNLYTLVWIFFR